MKESIPPLQLQHWIIAMTIPGWRRPQPELQSKPSAIRAQVSLFSHTTQKPHQLGWEKQPRNPGSPEPSSVQDFSSKIHRVLFFVVSIVYMFNMNMFFQKQLQ